MPKFVELTQPSRRRKHLPGAAEVDFCFGFTGESANSSLNPKIALVRKRKEFGEGGGREKRKDKFI